MANFVAAADIGGSHITVRFIEIDRLTAEESVVRLKVDSKGDKETILNTWFQAFDQLTEQTGIKIEKIAFAMPGPFDYSEGISLIQGVDKYESLYGENIRKAFSDRFNIDPNKVVFRNDAEAFLHGEMLLGRYDSADGILGFTLGTGFGSAYSRNGYTCDLVAGLSPFKDSIADNYLSTRWFRKKSLELLGEDLEVKDLALQAEKGDESALRIFDEFAQNFYEVVAHKVKDHEAVYIIIGGNIAKAHAYFLSEIYQLFDASGLKINIKLAQASEYAAMIGSAHFFQSKLIKSHV